MSLFYSRLTFMSFLRKQLQTSRRFVEFSTHFVPLAVSQAEVINMQIVCWRFQAGLRNVFRFFACSCEDARFTDSGGVFFQAAGWALLKSMLRDRCGHVLFGHRLPARRIF